VSAGGHALFGGSTASRWLRCPASVRLARAASPNPVSPQMLRGTHAHALLEYCVCHPQESPDKFLGRSLIAEARPFDKEDIDAVKVAVAWVDDMQATRPGCKVFPERYMALDTGFGGDVGGTADVIIVDKKNHELLVMDYKHGAGVFVDAGTPQLQLYAAAAMRDPFIVKPRTRIDSVKAVVIQPRCNWGGKGVTRERDYTKQQMDDFVDSVAYAVALAGQEDVPPKPGDEQCRWCPALKNCEEGRAWKNALKVGADVPFAGREVTAQSVERWLIEAKTAASSVAEGSAITVSAKELGRLLTLWRQGEALGKKIEELALQRALDGEDIPGYGLVPTRPVKKWLDEAAAEISLAKLGVLPWTKKLLTVGEALKAVPVGQEHFLDPLIVAVSSGHKLIDLTK